MSQHSKSVNPFVLGVLQSVCGGAVTSLGTAIWEHFCHRSVDWWGIAALFVGAGTVFAALLWLTRRASAPIIIGPRRYGLPPSAAEDHPLMSSSQLAAFKLAQEMREFLHDLSKKPHVVLANFGTSKEGAEEFLAAKQATEGEWRNRLIHSYANRFASRVKEVMHQLGEAGANVAFLERYTHAVGSEMDLMHAARQLEYAAIDANYRPILISDSDREIVEAYETLTAGQMERLLNSDSPVCYMFNEAHGRLKARPKPEF